MDGLRKGLWLAWCPKCKSVMYFGDVYKQVGWPYCNKESCKVYYMESPGWPSVLYKWVPPDDGDGVLRIWNEEE